MAVQEGGMHRVANMGGLLPQRYRMARIDRVLCSCTWDVHCAESVGGTP